MFGMWKWPIPTSCCTNGEQDSVSEYFARNEPRLTDFNIETHDVSIVHEMKGALEDSGLCENAWKKLK